MPQFVTRDARERLRTTQLDLPEWIGAPRPSTFGELVSWAVWAPEIDGVSPLTTAADLSVLTPDRLDGVARVDVVFVTMGAVARPSPAPTWSNHHTGRRDFLPGRFLAGSESAREHLGGAYVTSVDKGRAMNSDMDLATEVRRMDPEYRERFFAVMRGVLEREFEILGATDPVLVAAGDYAARWIADMFGDRYRIVKFPSWSRSLSNAKFLVDAERAVRRAFR